MKYARPPFPPKLYSRFRRSAEARGWKNRGDVWRFLATVLDYADMNHEKFRPVETSPLGNGCLAYFPGTQDQLDVARWRMPDCPNVKKKTCRCYVRALQS